MSFENGILNLTNWLGNVIMPTMAVLLFAVAIVRYAKGYPWNYSMWAAAALCVSGLLRALETFGSPEAARHSWSRSSCSKWAERTR
ncbi:MAG: hypothetical protein ACUVXB_16400 [Bryobacteraceae bacterium]